MTAIRSSQESAASTSDIAAGMVERLFQSQSARSERRGGERAGHEWMGIALPGGLAGDGVSWVKRYEAAGLLCSLYFR